MWVGGQAERRKGKGGGWDDTGENRKHKCSNTGLNSAVRTPRLNNASTWAVSRFSRTSQGDTKAAVARTTGQRAMDGWEGKWGSGRTKAAIARTTEGRQTGERVRADHRWADPGVRIRWHLAYREGPWCTLGRSGPLQSILARPGASRTVPQLSLIHI